MEAPPLSEFLRTLPDFSPFCSVARSKGMKCFLLYLRSISLIFTFSLVLKWRSHAFKSTAYNTAHKQVGILQVRVIDFWFSISSVFTFYLPPAHVLFRSHASRGRGACCTPRIHQTAPRTGVRTKSGWKPTGCGPRTTENTRLVATTPKAGRYAPARFR